MAEIILGQAGEKLQKLCNNSNVALSEVVENMLARITIGEVNDIIEEFKKPHLDLEDTE